jgi:ribosomal protein L16 Arg81 hydroxylase
MEQTNKKTNRTANWQRFRNILLFLTGMATGYSFCHLFGNAHRAAAGNAAATVTAGVAKNPAVLQKEVAASERATDAQIELTEKRSEALKSELQQAKAALKKAGEKNLRLQAELYSAFETAATVLPESRDTAILYQPDNVFAALDTLIAVNAVKDSLHSNIAQNLQSQIDNKDSAIAAQGRHIEVLRQDFDLSIASQTFLKNENRRLEKKLKRRKLGGKIKSAGLLILSGLALKSILH